MFLIISSMRNVEDADDLSTYSYVEIRMEGQEVNTDAIYISNAYVRSDAMGSYVMKDDGGVLAKQYVKTGKTYWGEAVEIIEGITMEDSLAFPYGDGAIEGITTVEAEGGGMYY